MGTAGLKTIILLSFVLALSFLLIILSCALWSNWAPLYTAAIFTLAPLPNFLCSRIVLSSSSDDFGLEGESSGPVDFGHFLTAMFIVSGVALPLVLAHSGVTTEAAGVMSMVGGAVGYGTMITYSHFFSIQIEDY